MKNGPILTITIDSETPGAMVAGVKTGTGFGLVDRQLKNMGAPRS